MRLALAAGLAAATILTAAHALSAPPALPTIDMCAITTAGYAGDLYDNDWLAKLPTRLEDGTVSCLEQSMRSLGNSNGRSYGYWQATFGEQREGYDTPIRHVVAEVVEIDADGTQTIIHRVSSDDTSEPFAAKLVERNGLTLIALTDPEVYVYARKAVGFVPVHTGLAIYSLPAGVVDKAMPEGYVTEPHEDDGDDGLDYRTSFDVETLSQDLPLAVASEITPRTHVDTSYDRPITLRFPVHLDANDQLVIDTPDLVEGAAIPGGIGETPASFSIPAGVKECTVSAYLRDSDPAGVTVRATPDPKGLPIATLPASDMLEDSVFGAEVSVIGSYKDWFLIENAQHPAQMFGEDVAPPDGAGSVAVRTAYSGRGWVHGSRLSTDIQSGSYLRQSADPASKPVFDLKLSDETYALVTGFKSCVGDAVELSAKRSGDGVEGTGWIGGDDKSRLCSNEATTCS